MYVVFFMDIGHGLGVFLRGIKRDVVRVAF